MIKYVEYLIHNHPFDSLLDDIMDGFQEKMATKLFYMRDLSM